MKRTHLFILFAIGLLASFSFYYFIRSNNQSPLAETRTPELTAAPGKITSTAEEVVLSITGTPAPPVAQAATPELLATPTTNWRTITDPRLLSSDWRKWPVIPDYIPLRSLQIYQAALDAGRDPYRFSKIGDCQSVSGIFFGVFETRPDYSLTKRVFQEYPEDAASIAYFPGSWMRDSLAVADGLSVNTVLSPLWSDTTACEPNEHPLACEIRVWNPSIVIISLGTVWQPNAEQSFETQLRKVVQYAIEQNVLPILVTKADNVENNNYYLNQIITQIALEEQVPLWNFWLSVQKLPSQGIDKDHLSEGSSSPVKYIYLTGDGWEMKSLTGLQTLHFLLKTLQQEGLAPTDLPTPPEG